MTPFAESAVADVATGGGLAALAGSIIAAVKLLIDWSERRASRRADEAEKVRAHEERKREEDAGTAERMALLLREMVTAMVRFEGTLAKAVDNMVPSHRRRDRADKPDQGRTQS